MRCQISRFSQNKFLIDMDLTLSFINMLDRWLFYDSMLCHCLMDLGCVILWCFPPFICLLIFYFSFLQEGVNILAVNYGAPGACPHPRQLKLVSQNWSLFFVHVTEWTKKLEFLSDIKIVYHYLTIWDSLVGFRFFFDPFKALTPWVMAELKWSPNQRGFSWTWSVAYFLAVLYRSSSKSVKMLQS